MVHKRFVKRNGKVFGPYLYESYRDEKGDVKKRYLGLEKNEKSTIPYLKMFLFLGLFIVLFFSVNVLLDYSFGDGDAVRYIVEQQKRMTGLIVGDSISEMSESSVSDDSSSDDSSSDDSSSDDSSSDDSVSDDSSSDDSSSDDSGFDDSDSDDSDSDDSSSDDSGFDDLVGDDSSDDDLVGDDLVDDDLVDDDLVDDDLVDDDLVDDDLVDDDLVDDDLVDDDPAGDSGGVGGGLINDSDSLLNDSLLNDSLLNDSLLNDSLLNESLLNESLLNDSLLNDSLLNDSLLNDSLLNDSLLNDSLLNDSLLNESLLNESLLNESINLSNVSVEVIQYRAVINRPVKWLMVVNSSRSENVSSGEVVVKLPKKAENISVVSGSRVEEKRREVEDYGEIVEKSDKIGIASGGLITGRVSYDISSGKNLFERLWAFIRQIRITGNVIVEDDLRDDALISEEDDAISVNLTDVSSSEEDLAVEYYTEGPMSFEKIEENKKFVVINSSEELNYTNVLAYSEIDELGRVYSKDQISLLWYEDENVLVNSSVGMGEVYGFDVYDLDDDGYFDYIEWNVTHLSNQGFVIIINIESAKHLDENRIFIQDIYDYVKEKDGVWSPVINNSEYVRVGFEKNLSSDKDITIYARSVGLSDIEVYEKDGEEIIALFENVTDEGWYKVYLDGSSGVGLGEGVMQDTYDLRVVCVGGGCDGVENESLVGGVEFDYIVDPVSVDEIEINVTGSSNTLNTTYHAVDDEGKMKFTLLQNLYEIFLPMNIYGEMTFEANLSYTGYGDPCSDGLDAGYGWTTVFVNDQINVVGGNLTIEPGVVIKFNESGQINLGYGGMIRSVGFVNESVSCWVSYTSMNDNKTGANISGSSGLPSAGDYYSAIVLESDASNYSSIEFNRFFYANVSLNVSTLVNYTQGLTLTNYLTGRGISHNQFGNFETGILLNQNQNVSNNLFYGIIKYGVWVLSGISNGLYYNTFDGCNVSGYGQEEFGCGTGYGIYNDGGTSVTGYGNILANLEAGVVNNSGGLVIDYNACYNNTDDVVGVAKGVNAVALASSPFDTNAVNGDYYLTSGSDAVDGGHSTAALLGLDKYYTGSSADSGTADIGYHYPNASGIIGDVTPPEIYVFSPENITYTTSTIYFNASATEDISTWIVNYNGTNITLSNINTTLEVLDGSYQLLMYGSDSSGNFGLNNSIYFTVDTSPPIITNITINPSSVGLGQIVNITVNVTDPSLVNSVLAQITRPGGSSVNYTMTEYATDLYYNDTYRGWYNGSYEVVVYAYDSLDNLGYNDSESFDVFNDNITVQVRTLQDGYKTGELINLTDPPEVTIGINGTVNYLDLDLVVIGSSFTMNEKTIEGNVTRPEDMTSSLQSQSDYSGIVYTNFWLNSQTTNLLAIDLSSDSEVSNVILAENDGAGKIRFLENVMLNNSYDLDSAVEITSSKVVVNSTKYPSLNKRAYVTVTTTPMAEPVIYKDGEVCGDCEVVFNDRKGTFTFEVAGFSEYTWEEGNQSKVENNGTNNISFYLVMRTQFYDSGSWVDEDTVINDSASGTLRTVNVSDLEKLDLIWNPNLYNSSNLSSGDGLYRVYVELLGGDSNVLTDVDGNELIASYNFTFDNVAPYRVELVVPENESSFPDNDNDINFTWMATDSVSETMYCNLTLNGEVIEENVLSINGTNASYYYEDLAVGDYLWNVTCWDNAGNTNSSETWELEIYVSNTKPNTPIVYINSTDGTNRTLQNLNCYSTISDDDSDDLNVTVIWYLDGGEELIVDYNNSYSSGVLFNAVLLSGNTTKHDNWSCAIRLDDGQLYSDWGYSENLTILNTPPVVTLSYPLNINITDRIVTFNWTCSDDDDDLCVEYEFEMDCIKYYGSYDEYGVQYHFADGITENNYTRFAQCILDNGYGYNWSVRASDSEDFGEWVSGSFNVTGVIGIELERSSINFGSLDVYGTPNDTTSDNPEPFLMKNIGNVLVNISHNATQLFDSRPSESDDYKIKVDNVTGEVGAFRWVSSVFDWINVSLTGQVFLIDRLNYTETNNSAEIDIYVRAPSGESPGEKSSIVIFEPVLAE
jgi:hypothetical protein